MKRILLFLADGFEEVEALTVVDYLRRIGVEVNIVSITEDERVKGAHDIVVIADNLINQIKDIDLYDGAIIPGGIPGATNLRDDDMVIDIVKKINAKEKLVAAICAGPVVLERANIIKGKRITSYPGFEDELRDGNYIENNVARDGNIITARGPALAVDFGIEIIRYLLGEEKVKELKKDILYKEN